MPDENTSPPSPVVFVTLEPKSRADELKLAEALSFVCKEDKTLRVATDVETGKTLLSGMGELHLELVLARLKREFHVAVDAGKLRVSYRETIRKSVREEARFIRQSLGRRQFAQCTLQLEPLPRGQGRVFVDACAPGLIPPEFIPEIEKGVRQALDGGALTRCPIIDIKVALVDGVSRAEESNEMSFKICGAMALRSGCTKADPVILEPIMRLTVTTPEQYAGDVVGDLNSRRAKIEDMGDSGPLKFIRGTAPMSELFGYAAFVNALTQSRASFVMELSHYKEVPWGTYQASIDPHGPEEPPTASAGRPVRPVRPRPGLSGGESRPFPPEPD